MGLLLLINAEGWVEDITDLTTVTAEVAKQIYQSHLEYYPDRTYRLVTDPLLIAKLQPRIRAFRLVDGALVEDTAETDRRAARRAITAREKRANDMIHTNETRRLVNMVAKALGDPPDSWSDAEKAYFNKLKKHFNDVHADEDVTTIGRLNPAQVAAELAKANPVDPPSE